MSSVYELTQQLDNSVNFFTSPTGGYITDAVDSAAELQSSIQQRVHKHMLLPTYLTGAAHYTMNTAS
jgi:hypothetical protein